MKDPSSVDVLEHPPRCWGNCYHMVGSDLTVHQETHCPVCSEGGLQRFRRTLACCFHTMGPLFLFLEPILPRLNDNPGEDVCLMQGAGIFLAIKVYCSLHPCGSPAQEFPAPAHVLSLCLFVDVGGPSPGGMCELYCWVRLLGPGFTFIQSGARLVLALSFGPRSFLGGLV